MSTAENQRIGAISPIDLIRQCKFSVIASSNMSTKRGVLGKQFNADSMT